MGKLTKSDIIAAIARVNNSPEKAKPSIRKFVATVNSELEYYVSDEMELSIETIGHIREMAEKIAHELGRHSKNTLSPLISILPSFEQWVYLPQEIQYHITDIILSEEPFRLFESSMSLSLVSRRFHSLVDSLLMTQRFHELVRVCLHAKFPRIFTAEWYYRKIPFTTQQNIQLLSLVKRAQQYYGQVEHDICLGKGILTPKRLSFEREIELRHHEPTCPKYGESFFLDSDPNILLGMIYLYLADFEDTINARVKSTAGYNTLLQKAITHRRMDVVFWLLGMGADPNLKASTNLRLDSLQDTPLLTAVLAKGQAYDIAHLLVQVGAKPNLVCASNCSPLHYAVIKTERCLETVNLLIENDADINLQNKHGYTPLHLANSEAIPLLTNRGADVNCRTNCGDTPILSKISEHPRVTLASTDVMSREYQESLNEWILCMHLLLIAGAELPKQNMLHESYWLSITEIQDKNKQHTQVAKQAANVATFWAVKRELRAISTKSDGLSLEQFRWETEQPAVQYIARRNTRANSTVSRRAEYETEVIQSKRKSCSW